jgi:antitoxin (DNA-binding transcriptional repressor) of toxin-antitoxin stability system
MGADRVILRRMFADEPVIGLAREHTADNIVCPMKTVSKREFYRTPALVRSLKAGQSVLVTDQGETSFLVVKPGRLPHKTTAELAAEAERLLPGRRRRVNVVKLLRNLRA